MTYKTYAQLKTEVVKAEDLDGEDFAVAAEILEWFNEAITICESKIHTIYEDYFLRVAYLAMVNGEEKISLPSDIYANKLRGIIYRNGNEIYPLDRIRRKDKFYEQAVTDYYSSSEERYGYFIINESASDGPRILLRPKSRETASVADERLECWYLREANRMDGEDATQCDIPEFYSYIVQYVKVMAITKEIGNPKLPEAKAKLLSLEADMISTLKEMVPDGDDVLEQDLEHYELHS